MLLTSFENHELRDHFPPFAGFKDIESSAYYGKGYQDVEYRTPSIKNARRILHWQPEIAMQQTVTETLDFFLRAAVIEKTAAPKDELNAWSKLAWGLMSIPTEERSTGCHHYWLF